MTQIHDHGESDPLEYVLDRNDKAVADFAGKIIHIHRMQLNDRDKARQAAANEREIAQWMEVG